MADEIAAAGAVTDWDAELERSRQASGRLLNLLARKLGASRAAHYVKTHSARQVANGLKRAAGRSPVYALLAAMAAGFLLGSALKGSFRRK